MAESPQSSFDVPVQTQINLLKQDLQLWVNTRYVFANRLESNLHLEKLGLADADEIKEIKRMLEKCQAQISFFDKQIQSITKQLAPSELSDKKHT